MHEAHCLNDPDSSSFTDFQRILPVLVPALGLPAILAIKIAFQISIQWSTNEASQLEYTHTCRKVLIYSTCTSHKQKKDHFQCLELPDPRKHKFIATAEKLLWLKHSWLWGCQALAASLVTWKDFWTERTSLSCIYIMLMLVVLMESPGGISTCCFK